MSQSSHYCGAARCFAVMSFALLLPISSQYVQAERATTPPKDRVAVVRKGTSSRTTRKQALAALPVDQLTGAARERVDAVLQSTSMFRALPTVSFQVDPNVYRFFLAHPEVAVSIWRALDISEFELERTGQDRYVANAGDGSTGAIEVLYRDDRQCLLICDGKYKNPFMVRPIKASAVIHLQNRFSRKKDGTEFVEHRIHMFASFPSQTVKAAARIVSPVSNMIVDRNFRDVSLFVHMMSVAMERRPGWIERLASRLNGIMEIRKEQFLRLAAQVFVTARKRDLIQASMPGDISVDRVMDPLRQSAHPTSIPDSRNRSKLDVAKRPTDDVSADPPFRNRVVSNAKPTASK